MERAPFSTISVAAETHPPGYAFHKYWARKPHNVVREALQAAGVRPGALLLDPFCGSGVPLSEGAALGATGTGCDVNPTAVELTRVTLAPPEPEPCRAAIEALIGELELRYGPDHLADGRARRYSVHATVVACAGCSRRVAAHEAVRRGRTYACPGCGARLSMNLEHLVATHELSAVLTDGTELGVGVEHGLPGRAAPRSACDQALTPNPRILAYPGMRTRDLFSPRNFAVIAAFAAAIAHLPAAVQPAARLTLSSAAAQCSRLVAFRNDLTTGGAAWTVPGFWVPPIHLETNPFHCLRTRLARLHRGLTHLRALPGRGQHHTVCPGDAVEVLQERAAGQPRAAVAFFDPPYGDSVPYLEFSALWNGLWGNAPDPGLDLAVSDRTRGDGTWESYTTRLRRVALALSDAMTRDARIVVTFNNRDARAWYALLAALQGAGFGCRGAFYQAPAVVSAKAQLAPHGSYVGDIYALFARTRAAPPEDPTPIVSLLAATRQRARVPLAERALERLALLESLRANLAASTVATLPALCRDE